MKLNRSIQLLLVCILSTAHCSANKVQPDSVVREIKLMFLQDQRYRWMIMYAETDEQKLNAYRMTDGPEKIARMREVFVDKDGKFKALKDSLWALQRPIDSANFARSKAIIEAFGYPQAHSSKGHMEVILSHNSEMVIRTNFLAKLKDEVNKKRMKGMEYAVLYDRAMLETKQPELYYVIGDLDEDGNTYFHTPADLDATNKARKEIGIKRFKQLSGKNR